MKKEIYKKKLKVKDLPLGGVIDEGKTSLNFHTGDWRTERPIRNNSKCDQCFICWVNCPDNAIISKNGKVLGINYNYCKGCGICAEECLKKAIKMVKESR